MFICGNRHIFENQQHLLRLSAAELRTDPEPILPGIRGGTPGELGTDLPGWRAESNHRAYSSQVLRMKVRLRSMFDDLLQPHFEEWSRGLDTTLSESYPPLTFALN